MNEEIKEKIDYCLNCKLKPCSVNGCPLNNDIPMFIKYMKDNQFKDAYESLCNTTILQSICGRICPHKKQCEGSCIRGIKGESVNIGDLEVIVGDYAIDNNLEIPKEIDNNLVNKKVAIVGGGPAGLTCSAFLARKGVKVTIYERYNFLGGLLMYGIPDFRLEKNIVKRTIQKILDLGIDVKYNKILGKNLKLEELEKEYDKIFLAFGGNKSLKMRIEGEDLDEVYGANELLEYENYPDFNEKTVIVNGAGNVAIDIARTIKRKGAKKVIIVYRRSKKEMPAEEKEIIQSEKEGIEFLFQNNIVKIDGNKKVESIELIRTELVKKEGENRLSPINIEGTNYTINADYVVMALGSETDEFVKNLKLELTSKKNIMIDENYRTSNPKIFAGGDLVGCTKTVAWAAKSGRDAAEKIIEELKLGTI